MKLREALIRQAPNLALQREASAEIARLDAKIFSLRSVLLRLREDLEDNDFELALRRVRSAIDNPEL